jgi:hypothetical protein
MDQKRSQPDHALYLWLSISWISTYFLAGFLWSWFFCPPSPKNPIGEFASLPICPQLSIYKLGLSLIIYNLFLFVILRSLFFHRLSLKSLFFGLFPVLFLLTAKLLFLVLT